MSNNPPASLMRVRNHEYARYDRTHARVEHPTPTATSWNGKSHSRIKSTPLALYVSIQSSHSPRWYLSVYNTVTSWPAAASASDIAVYAVAIPPPFDGPITSIVTINTLLFSPPTPCRVLFI